MFCVTLCLSYFFLGGDYNAYVSIRNKKFFFLQTSVSVFVIAHLLYLLHLTPSISLVRFFFFFLLWIHFMLSRFPTKHQHSESTDHVVPGPKIPANQLFCSSSSVRSANQKNVASYQAAPVTNACHMTVTSMETVTRNKICSWIWKGPRLSVPDLLWYKMPPTLFQKLFNKRNAFSSPPPRCSKEDPAFR